MDFFSMLKGLLPRGNIWNPWIKQHPEEWRDTIGSETNDNPAYQDNTIDGYPAYQDNIAGTVLGEPKNSVFGDLLLIFSQEIARLHDRIYALMNESIPGLSVELLSDWETVAGLPNEFTPVGLSVEERQSLVHQKITQGKGTNDGLELTQNESFFIDYAANMGYTITISYYGTPFRVGVSRVGDRVGGSAVSYYWVVTGDYDSILQSLFEEIKPAHTIIVWG